MADSAPDDDRAPEASEPAPRRRGLVGSGYILGPVVLLWGVGLGVSWVVGQRHRPEMVPFTVGLYGCAAFFVHAYWLAWRAGTIVRRYSALSMAILILVALAALHADDAEARLVWSIEGPRDRPAMPGLFGAAAADLVAATLLLLHGVILGLGSRAARAIETALGIDDEDIDLGAGDDAGDAGRSGQAPAKDAPAEGGHPRTEPGHDEGDAGGENRRRRDAAPDDDGAADVPAAADGGALAAGDEAAPSPARSEG